MVKTLGGGQSMELYIKQRLFSWGDRFSVYDRNGNEKYYVEGEIFSWGKKLHLCSAVGSELAFIKQEFALFTPTYSIYRGERLAAEVIKEFTFFKHAYTVSGPGWKVFGDFWDHDYEITDYSGTVASVSKEWFTLGDAYKIDIAEGGDEITALAVVLVIDACIEASRRN